MTTLEGFVFVTRNKTLFNVQATATRNGRNVRGITGNVGVQDLWDLNADVLETEYIKLKEEYDQLAGTSTGSIRKKKITKPTNAMKELQAKMQVLEYIVGVKDNEDLAKASAAEKRKKKAVLMAALERKQNEALENKSLEELQAELNALED